MCHTPVEVFCQTVYKEQMHAIMVWMKQQALRVSFYQI